ncbi:methyltransferase domain-containing protein [Shewanella sp. 202IG2-18]|uniref:class I SAM-dependent methyltransferase n=1 Tax=Parashewanella hymeniacidonis TaxID=2807618 RepID=UPI001960D869|nr:class I SAM-dependent methyltransferase [Parashewanella hymeniacidonis]MBM7073873.1 methyltransferase domain-containing protein [Parashewanella hymeniacidonis]
MDYLKVNKETWDKRTEIHVKSDFYNVDGFIKGDCTLNDIELSELGDVTGKSLLHLQCHFGLDTLSWARRGAKVTGVDLSSSAIEKAQELASAVELDSQFVCSDVYSFDEKSDDKFDIVYTSYGVICWLPDLDKWAQLISNKLNAGGTFYMAEFHPIYDIVEGYSYFYKNEPDIEEEATYSENAGEETSTVVLWPHPISEVLNALIKSGIKIEQFNEFPYSPYNCFDGLEKAEEGKYIMRHKGQLVPLIYSIKGVKI